MEDEKMTVEQEEKLISQVGEMHGVLFRNGLVKRMTDLEKQLSSTFRTNIALLISGLVAIIALISLISKLAGLW